MNKYNMNRISSTVAKSILLMAFSGMSTLFTYSQSCLPTGITISTQQQIDDFATTYPSCTQIDGNLIIISSILDPIYSLAGLSQLTAVNGDLRIAENNQLLSLTGLENITSLNGNLLIFENSSLDDLSAISNLTSIRGFLTVGKNDALTNLFGLQNINFGITDFRIFDNDVLSECNIANLCTYLSNGGNHTISSNAFGCSESSQILSICFSDTPCTRNRLRLNFAPILDGTYQAIEEVTSFGRIPNGGSVDFIAGMTITLYPGFEVESAATFTASINECGL